MARNADRERQQAEQQQPRTEKGTDEADPQVQAAVDVETEKGFRGIEVDRTPNEAYTLPGQNAGAATPETDADAAEKARLAQVDAAGKATGVAGR